MAAEAPCAPAVETPPGRERAQHGTALFPIACYNEDLTLFGVPWHWHEDFEYILAEQGRLTVTVGKARFALEAGQGVFINSGALHAVDFAAQGPAVLHSGVFHPRLAGGMDTVFWQKYTAPLLAPGAPEYFVLNGAAPWHAGVLACLQDAWSAMTAGAPGHENIVRFKLTGALRVLASHLPVHAARVPAQQQEAAARMRQMLSFVEKNCAEPLSVKSIAASVSLSESACLRSFKQLLGTTPIQYVKQYRIEKAAELLLTTRLKASEVGAECGFADTSYFTKAFRETKKCTPHEYRRRFGAAL